MSKTWINKEFTLLCPKMFTNNPTCSDHPGVFLAYRKHAAFISSTSANATRGSTPPSASGTMPTTSMLNHCQWRFFVVRKRCRLAIEAVGTQLGSEESQWRSLSGLFAQMRYFSWYGPRAACSSASDACVMLPAPSWAKTLKGLSFKVSVSVMGSTRPAKVNSSRNATAPPRPLKRCLASLNCEASVIFGIRATISPFKEVAPSTPRKALLWSSPISSKKVATDPPSACAASP
mmetsp:Transcript_73908/g.154005  ORF Transcript_73908/g.154005 Transcript_73908/m.154005 type:complete len:233 (-) Transcript_73908:115-813(-)